MHCCGCARDRNVPRRSPTFRRKTRDTLRNDGSACSRANARRDANRIRPLRALSGHPRQQDGGLARRRGARARRSGSHDRPRRIGAGCASVCNGGRAADASALQRVVALDEPSDATCGNRSVPRESCLAPRRSRPRSNRVGLAGQCGWIVQLDE